MSNAYTFFRKDEHFPLACTLIKHESAITKCMRFLHHIRLPRRTATDESLTTAKAHEGPQTLGLASARQQRWKWPVKNTRGPEAEARAAPGPRAPERELCTQ